MDFLATFIRILFEVLTWAIVLRALLPWFNLPPAHPLLVLLADITEPILSPLRRVVPRIGMLDISPIVAILVLQLAGNWLVTGLVRGAF